MTHELAFRPYNDDAKDFLYNLLFCDDRELFRPCEGEPGGALAVIFGAPARTNLLRDVAEDEDAESRHRALAFNRLREMGVVVPAHIVLGTIVEVAMPEGLDTLAAYADGRVRYLNHAGAPAIFEQAPKPVGAKAHAVLEASQPVVERIGPWAGSRRAPPERDHARLTFLVSDGLYFGEGKFGDLAHDAMSAPLIAASVELLTAATDAVLKK